MFLTTPKYRSVPKSELNYTTSSVDKFLDEAFNLSDPVGSIFRDIWAMETTNFPPYNVISKNEGKQFVIELAVAGFSRDEIQIQSDNGNLVITGVKEAVSDKVSYLTHGIAYRNFTRSFTLARDVKVDDAVFENGLLKINLSKVQPEPKKKNLIAIG